MSKIDWSRVITREQREAEAEQAAWDALRAERDRRIAASDWLVVRHSEELLGQEPTLSADDFAALSAYRQTLRDLPEQTSDPESPVWPVSPLDTVG